MERNLTVLCLLRICVVARGLQERAHLELSNEIISLDRDRFPCSALLSLLVDNKVCTLSLERHRRLAKGKGPRAKARGPDSPGKNLN
jgi:hypothetical protein